MTGEPVGVEVPVIWRGRRVRAFVPTLLADRDLTLSAATVERTATAVADVSHSAAALPADYAPLARLLLRAEGIASSYIEGVSAPVVDVVLAETAPGGGHTPAAWVAANLAAVGEAIASAGSQPLSVELLSQWHRTLMAGSPTPARYVGAIRDEQGWIGGTSPLDANLVTPPASSLPILLEDLVAYANRTDVDPITQAAVGHAQFEIIHPFADGNGRVG
ncbi:MAG: Fic family protein, partial [Actinomycetes bacterium]